MIALVVSALIAIYLLIPNELFRFALGWFVPVRAFAGTKTEEIRRAVLTLLVLFVAAFSAVRYLPIVRSYPYPFADTAELRASDYSLVAGGLYSEAIFKESAPQFWDAFWRTLKRQGRLVAWYYLFVFLMAIWVGFLSTAYGKKRHNDLYYWFADFYLLPHISQWHVLLSGFTFPPKTTVKADVLMSDDLLYRGEVADYFLDHNGSLDGIFLRNPERFDRGRYLKEKQVWGTTRPTSSFWKSIPSAKLYLIASQIINLNLNYEPPTASQDVVNRYIQDFLKRSSSPSVSLNLHIHRAKPETSPPAQQKS